MRPFLLLISLCSFAWGQESIVCLHGFMRTQASFRPLVTYLETLGQEITLFGYKSRNKTIEEHAENLLFLLQVKARQSPQEPIHFVAHSLGGLILRVALNHPDCPKEAQIGTAILLAPPNGGSRLARHLSHIPLCRLVFGSHSGHQLMSFTREEIENLGRFPPSLKLICITGSRDWKVRADEARLSEPHEHFVVPSGHAFIMQKAEVFFLIEKYLVRKEE
ncbi:MAG: esterase/lipase family protein [Chlamydiales bacterium]